MTFIAKVIIICFSKCPHFRKFESAVLSPVPSPVCCLLVIHFHQSYLSAGSWSRCFSSIASCIWRVSEGYFCYTDRLVGGAIPIYCVHIDFYFFQLLLNWNKSALWCFMYLHPDEYRSVLYVVLCERAGVHCNLRCIGLCLQLLPSRRKTFQPSAWGDIRMRKAR